MSWVNAMYKPNLPTETITISTSKYDYPNQWSYSQVKYIMQHLTIKEFNKTWGVYWLSLPNTLQNDSNMTIKSKQEWLKDTSAAVLQWFFCFFIS